MEEKEKGSTCAEVRVLKNISEQCQEYRRLIIDIFSKVPEPIKAFSKYFFTD